MKAENKSFENAMKIKDNYSLHTFTIKRQLLLEEKNKILDLFTDAIHSGGIVKKYKMNRWENVVLKRYWTSVECTFNYIDIYEIRRNETKSYFMTIKINPRAMLHKKKYPYVYIASQEDIVCSMQLVDEFWRVVGLPEIQHESFYVSRIDYCVNIMMKSRDEVKAYMRLIRKGAYPRNTVRKMEWSESGKRSIPTKNSFTVYNDSVELSIYDKYMQLKEEGDKYSEKELQKAQNIIRIELRVKRRKVHYEEKKHSIEGIEEYLKRTHEIAEENIPRYLREAYGKGVLFVRYADAMRTVEESNLKKKSKKKLKEIIKLTMIENLQMAKENYTSEKWRRNMELFAQLGISPITLQNNSKIQFMTHPIFYMEHSCANNEKFIQRRSATSARA